MEDSIDKLIGNLQEFDPTNPDAGWMSCMELGNKANVGNKKVIQALIGAMNPMNDAATRAHAAEALGSLKDPDSIASLQAALLSDKYRLTRSYSAKSLGECGNVSSIKPLLIALQRDDFFGVRAEAAEALGKICVSMNDKEMEDKIQKVLEERSDIEKDMDDRGVTRVRNEIKTSILKINAKLSESREGLEKNLEEAKKAGTDTKALDEKIRQNKTTAKIFDILLKKMDRMVS